MALITAVQRSRFAYAVGLMLLFQGCTQTRVHSDLRQDVSSAAVERKVLAVYEPWFGHPSHISVGYSSQDPVTVRKQMDEAKALGISGFVVDWYGDREPFLDHSYALLQTIAAEKNFKIAMMYDETQPKNGQATDDTLAAFEKFHQTYLAPNAPGRDAYLTYNGRPMIFIFPKSSETDWNRVREETNSWEASPLLIYEDRSTPYAAVFDGFYAWVNPGKKGFSPDGVNWGEDYLRDFYQRMRTKYPDKITVGAAWAGFDDSKASWGLHRYIAQRCGKTFSDTLQLAREDAPNAPFLLIATWNDYEEGTAIERGLAKCGLNTPASASATPSR
jgi:hypothetical protein